MADTEPLELSCLSRLHNHKEPGGKLLPILVQKDLLWVGGEKDTCTCVEEYITMNSDTSSRYLQGHFKKHRQIKYITAFSILWCSLHPTIPS